MNSPGSTMSYRARIVRPDRMAGISLIEVIIFIVIVSILATGLLSVFNKTLSGAPQTGQGILASQLAVERMELILPQRQRLGFSGFTPDSFDPCTSVPASTQTACTAVPGTYRISSKLQNDWKGDGNYKVITVTVSGPGSAEIQALVADY